MHGNDGRGGLLLLLLSPSPLHLLTSPPPRSPSPPKNWQKRVTKAEASQLYRYLSSCLLCFLLSLVLVLFLFVLAIFPVTPFEILFPTI